MLVAAVSGKGVPATLYMALTKGLLTAVAEGQSDPGAILRQVNAALHRSLPRRAFVTAFQQEAPQHDDVTVLVAG